MSSDDDYMSDVFLTKDAPEAGSRLSSSSLGSSAATKRPAKATPAPVPMMKRSKLEAVHRSVGLDRHLDTDNKGFQMLLKLGYKPGEGLGKQGVGITTPISVEVKCNRKGLGRAEFIKKLSSLKPDVSANSISDFRKRVSSKREDNMKERDLLKSQKACQQLDLDAGETIPVLEYFWPAPPKPKLIQDDVDEPSEVTALEAELDLEAQADEEGGGAGGDAVEEEEVILPPVLMID